MRGMSHTRHLIVAADNRVPVLDGETEDRAHSLLEATRVRLGKGEARIVEALGHGGHDGWVVLEQDTAITADEPTVTGGRRSIAFLHPSARSNQEVHR